MNSSIQVTVAVCSYNRAGMLAEALASLFALRTDRDMNYEILVVDNASTDATPHVIARAAAASPVPLRGVREPQPGVACARNRAIAEARGQWIAFFDDDQIADPDWLVELMAMARDRNLQCVGGAVRLRLPAGAPPLSPICRAQLGESVGMDSPMPYGLQQMPGTGNLLIHTDVFQRVGPFNDTLKMGAEDSDLYLRIFQAQIPAWYTPQAIVRHVIPSYRLQPEYFRWNCFRTGASRARRDRESHGMLGMAARCVARVAQIFLVGILRWLPARLRGNQAAALGWRCRMWRSEAYVRSSLQILAPRLFSQRTFSDYLEFRGERELLSDVDLVLTLPDSDAPLADLAAPQKTPLCANS